MMLKALRIKRNLTLLEIIAQATISEDKIEKNERQCKKTSLAAKNRLSPKQYYTSLSSLMRAGLIIKRKGSSVYVLSILGTRVYSALNLIKKVASNFWPLKAFDSMASTESDEDIETIIKIFIPDEELQRILLKGLVKKRMPV
jgi:predicted transcriptional regulator